MSADDVLRGDPEAVRRIANRLKRAQGQLAAVIASVEGGGDCRAVVTQLAAVSSALDRAGFAIIATAMKQCVVDEGEPAGVASTDSDPGDSGADAARPLTLDELEKLFLTLS